MAEQVPIEVKRANLETASITIRHVVIDGRKLTLSVFRQIPERELFDFKNRKLNGTVWGHVNYFWSDMRRRCRDPFHLLWQDGHHLHRHLLDSSVPHASELSKQDRRGLRHLASLASGLKDGEYGHGTLWDVFGDDLQRMPLAERQERARQLHAQLSDHGAVAVQEKFRAWYRDECNALREVPQLFIAV